MLVVYSVANMSQKTILRPQNHLRTQNHFYDHKIKKYKKFYKKKLQKKNFAKKKFAKKNLQKKNLQKKMQKKKFAKKNSKFHNMLHEYIL